jgi:hypothetical protein
MLDVPNHLFLIRKHHLWSFAYHLLTILAELSQQSAIAAFRNEQLVDILMIVKFS